MKKKLFIVLLSVGLLSAPVADAKPKDQITPRWVKEKWAQGYRCPKIENDFRKIGLPVKAFSYLAWRESRCQRHAIGWNYHKGFSAQHCRNVSAQAYKKCFAVRSYDSGLLQINSTWVTVTANVCGGEWGDLSVLRKKRCNLRVAKALFNDGGFVHWAIK